MQNMTPTSYLERLKISRDQVELFLEQPNLNLFQAAIAVLLVEGKSLPLSDLADRVEELGFESAVGDMEHSLRKAWHGQRPIYRDDADRFGLDLDTPEMEHFLRQLRVLNRQTATRAEPSAVPTVEPPDDALPLTREELEAALRGQFLANLSTVRKMAAVLDALDRSMSVEELEQYYNNLTSYRLGISAESLLRAHSTLIHQDHQGMFSVRKDHPDLRKVRREIRRIAGSVMQQKERSAQVAVRIEEYRIKKEEEQRLDEEQLASWRRAIVHVEPSPPAPAAAVVLDMRERTIKTFLGDQRGGLLQVLAEYDWLAGLSIRATLTGLGLDAERFRLAELSPAQKTRTLNRQGRKLTITPELVIASTTGISRPLGDPIKIAQYLAERQDTKLARRLESTAKALHAFYQQGALHGSVRLRWGFVDELLSLGWDNRGEQSLRRTLEQAREAGTCVDIVIGAVPGWENPWARARRVAVLSVDPWTVRLREGLAEMELSYHEIRAIRLTDPTSQRPVGPVPPLS